MMMTLRRLALVLAPLALLHCNGGDAAPPDGGAPAAADLAGSAAADAAALPDGGAPADAAAPQPGIYGGHCDTSPPAVTKQAWQHPIGATYATSLGGPNHRIRDLILAPGQKGVRLRGRFTYGTVDKDLEDEKIEVWFQRCPGWEKWATLSTDADGIVWADVPSDLPAGDYRVRMVVEGDLTWAEGVIAVWRPGVQAIVTDIDGTLTTSDWELFKDVIFGPDATMYADANTAMQAIAKKDYRIVYLTGRPQVVNHYTREWLAKRAFPLAPLQLTEDGTEVAPTNAGVGTFKADFIKDVQARVGVRFIAAYGNATTDIWAYEQAGLAKARTYIIGTNAGQGGTVPLASYTAHLPAIAALPDALQP